jgi:hypothetical protein
MQHTLEHQGFAPGATDLEPAQWINATRDGAAPSDGRAIGADSPPAERSIRARSTLVMTFL